MSQFAIVVTPNGGCDSQNNVSVSVEVFGGGSPGDTGQLFDSTTQTWLTGTFSLAATTNTLNVTLPGDGQNHIIELHIGSPDEGTDVVAKTEVKVLLCNGAPEGCCIAATDVTWNAACNPDGTADVTFTVLVNSTSTDCYPKSFYLDYGDGGFSANTFIATAPSGPQTFAFSHTYQQAQGQGIVVKVIQQAPSGCADVALDFALPNCQSDCCPVVETEVKILDCDENCNRNVTIDVTGPAKAIGCDTAVMHWTVHDRNGMQVATTAVQIDNATAINNQLLLTLDPALSPYTASLTVGPTTLCDGNPVADVAIVVPECAAPLECPEDITLSWTQNGCELDPDPGGECKRKVKFAIDGTLNPGCPAQVTNFRIDYGDGHSEVLYVSALPHSFEHLYSASGSIDVLLTVENPDDCLVLVAETIEVSACDPADCESDPSDPAPADPRCWVCPSGGKELVAHGKSEGWSDKKIKRRVRLCCVIVVLFALSVAFQVTLVASCLTWPWNGNPSNIAAALNYVEIFLLYGLVSLFCHKCSALCAVFWGLIIGFITSLVLYLTSAGSGATCLWLNPGTPWGGFLGGALFFILVMFISVLTLANSKPKCKPFPF